MTQATSIPPTMTAVEIQGKGGPDVLVAGRWVLRHGRHPASDSVDHAFATAMRALWPEA